MHVIHMILINSSSSSLYSAGYKPVIVMHGINDDAKGMTTMVEFIQDAHPGTEVYNVDAFNNLVCQI